MPDPSLYPHYIDEQGYAALPTPELFVCGWCATPNLEPLSELWAEVDGVFYPCLTGIERLDLVTHFNRPTMRTAGFAARFPAGKLGALVHIRPTPNRSEPPLASIEQHFTKEPECDAPAPAPHAPLISILLPAGGASNYHLFRALRSAINQTHSNWELCLAHDSSEATLHPYIAALAHSDARIHVLEFHGPTASLATLALHQAAGEYVALLAANDELHPNALLEIARTIEANRGAVLIYTDEECTDECGRAISRTLKPPYDSELLLQHDYIGGLACLRTSALRQAGGFRPELEPAQHWDALLRVSETAATGTILRVPICLYSRRLAPTTFGAPQFAQVLESCITRRGLRAVVRNGLSTHALRLKPLMNPSIRIAVFLRMGDGAQQTSVLLRSRFPSHASFFEIGISGVYSLENPAAPLLTLNDTEAETAIFISCAIDHVNHEFFEELAAQAQRPTCGIAGGVTAGYIGFYKEVRDAPYLFNNFFATKMELLREAGGLAALCRDSLEELCNKLTELTGRKGLGVTFTPYAVATVRSVNEANAVSMPAHTNR